MNPLVSVVVPCYNQGQYLSEALESVLSQTYKNWECIIVNDGSLDNTDEVAKIYCDKDNRFKYIQKENGGLSSARNAGLKVIKGDYVQFLDSDDRIDPAKFEKQIDSFSKNINLSLSISGYYSFDNSQKIYPTSQDWNNTLSSDFRYDILYRWDRHFSIPIHCALFKRKIVEEIQFDKQLLAKEDWLFWIKISEIISSVDYIDETLAHYRFHPESMTQNDRLMEMNGIKVLFVILENIKNNEKQAFSKRIEEDVLALLESKSNLNQILTSKLEKIQMSKAYRFYKFLTIYFSIKKRK